MMRRRWTVLAALLLAACGDGADGRGEPPSAAEGGGIAADTAAADMTGPEGTRAGQ